MAGLPQERRRQDRDVSARSAPERVLLMALGLIAFAGALVALWWLWSHSGAGSAVRDGSPGWAPDGRLIFASEQGGQTELFLADRVGSNRVQLTHHGRGDGGAAYSADGRWIAFEGSWDGNVEIYVRAAGSEATRRLTDNPAIDRAPAWSRDGQQIVFMSNRDNKGFDIYRMHADGSHVERLTTGRSNGFPQYSPDGGQLLLQIDRDAYIMSLSSGGLRQVTHDPANGMYPSWSPDGQRIAFASWRNGHSEIFTARPDGSDPQVVVTMPRGDAIYPRWSPDGRALAFVHVPGGVGRTPPVAAAMGIVYVVELGSGRISRVSR